MSEKILAAILQRAGQADIGGQEDMIIDIAIQLAQERDDAPAAPAD